MKITIDCRECSLSIPIVFSDKRIFVEKCENGHSNCIVVQSSLFELFFDLGCLAIHDGYYREAIFNFYSSLERFREYFIKFTLSNNDFPDEEINEMWKKMALQSERPEGAYQMLHLLLNKKSGEKIDELSRIRNDVIHKGKIPSKDEAKKFGEKIFEYINRAYSAINISDFLLYTMRTLEKEGDSCKSGYPSQTILFPGFQVALSNHGTNYSFEQKLIDIEIRKEIFFKY